MFECPRRCHPPHAPFVLNRETRRVASGKLPHAVGGGLWLNVGFRPRVPRQIRRRHHARQCRTCDRPRRALDADFYHGLLRRPARFLLLRSFHRFLAFPVAGRRGVPLAFPAGRRLVALREPASRRTGARRTATTGCSCRPAGWACARWRRGADRHHDRGPPPRVPHLRGGGRVRAGADPGTHRGRAQGRAGTWAQENPVQSLVEGMPRVPRQIRRRHPHRLLRPVVASRTHRHARGLRRATAPARPRGVGVRKKRRWIPHPHLLTAAVRGRSHGVPDLALAGADGASAPRGARQSTMASRGATASRSRGRDPRRVPCRAPRPGASAREPRRRRWCRRAAGPASPASASAGAATRRPLASAWLPGPQRPRSRPSRWPGTVPSGIPRTLPPGPGWL